jgi:hypothetical protein
MTDDDLLAGFEAATLEEFHHRDHVRAAWLFVRKYGVLVALDRFSAALKRFAVTKGRPQLYHATITWAYLLLINERLMRQSTASWDAFAAANADLLSWKPSLLDQYYTPELLWSDLARTSFVMPDRIAGRTAS